MFTEINYEFSVFGFHDRVLADAKDITMLEDIRTGNVAAYAAHHS